MADARQRQEFKCPFGVAMPDVRVDVAVDKSAAQLLRNGIHRAAKQIGGHAIPVLVEVVPVGRDEIPLKLETPEALAARLADIEVHKLPADELTTYRARVNALTPAEAAKITQETMPAVDQMAVVVVGKAAEIRAPLEAAFGPVTVVVAEGCAALGSVAK